MNSNPDPCPEQPGSGHSPIPPRQAHRFYCNPLGTIGEGLSDEPVRLDADQDRHARTVLRLGIGDPVELFDGEGTAAEGVLESGGRVRITAVRHDKRPMPTIDLAVAMPKARRADDMVTALSQVGVDRVVPLRTARGVAQPRPGRLDRFARAVIESAKQCRRDFLLRIDPITTLSDLLARQHDQRLICHGEAEALSRSALAEAQRVLILIGPEGGWTADELRQARSHGCVPWRLGPHVLRVETAAVAAASIARHLASCVTAPPSRR